MLGIEGHPEPAHKVPYQDKQQLWREGEKEGEREGGRKGEREGGREGGREVKRRTVREKVKCAGNWQGGGVVVGWGREQGKHAECPCRHCGRSSGDIHDPHMA